MSIAESANDEMPPRLPYHQARCLQRRQMSTLSSGSRPTTSSAAMPSIIASVARQTSGHEVTASPQPTVPSSASMRQSVRCRSAPLSFGSGYRTEIGVTRANRRHTRTSSIPSARARTGISTSSRPRASALWWVAPDAIQRAPASNADPESKRNMPFGPPIVS